MVGSWILVLGWSLASELDATGYRVPELFVEVDGAYFGNATMIASGLGCDVPEFRNFLSVQKILVAAKREAEDVVRSKRQYDPHLSMYALGDCVKLLRKCKSHQDTLAFMYEKQSTTTNNYTLLLDLIETYRSKTFVPLPPENALVVHLRLGDVIRDAVDSVEKLLICSGPAKNNHTALKSVYELLHDANQTNLRRVILVAGSHTKLKPTDPSWFYALGIKYAYQAAGYDVTLRLAPYPDEDFIFMSFARTFDPGCGGYSRFAANIVEQRGGTVVGRRF